MTTYLVRLTEAMTALSRDPRVVFLGQSIVAGGTAMTQTFRDVSRERMTELPVFENTQLGMCTGLSLTGAIPVCVFPRINFMLCAIDALVLHLDAIPLFSNFRPKVIIRTAIANPVPLDPGPQHVDPTDDRPDHLDTGIITRAHALTMNDIPYLQPAGYVAALRAMLRTVRVYELTDPARIIPAYLAALARPTSTILVERADLYEMEDVE